MRHALGILLLLATLSACGDDDSAPTVTDPPPPSATVTTDPDPDPDLDDPDGPVLVSASDGGGTVDPTATPLPDETAAAAFAGALDDGLAGQVVEAAAGFDVPPGEELYAAVVAIGCTPPETVTTVREGDAVRITAAKPKEDPEIQCLVPVTTVALVAVPG